MIGFDEEVIFMLKRIYIDNFRGLVNFELNFDSINLFLGGNGSGKSTVFEVLRKIQTFINGDQKIESIFKPSNCTRWQKIPVQKFELEIDGNGGIYKYELAIHCKKHKIEYERLSFDRKPLLIYEDQKTKFYRDDYSLSSEFVLPLPHSFLSLVSPEMDNSKLVWFKENLEKIIIVQIVPSQIIDSSKQEETKLNYYIDNFVSWYRYISHDQGKTANLISVLQGILPGFVSFKFEKLSEESRTLKLRFSAEADQSIMIDYGLNELSDGQKTIIALYTLIYCTQSEDYVLCIDEPENFLALPEIQPWLIELYDFCDEGKLQAVLISHHPECINYLLASPIGYWFERESNSPARVRKISNEEADDSGLQISELIARGWLHES
jgi:AAA15 family ATPase/GTPase